MIDFKAKSIVNHAVRSVSRTEQTFLLGKTLGYALGLTEKEINKVIVIIELETDSELTDEELGDDMKNISIKDLYHITKNKLKS